MNFSDARKNIQHILRDAGLYAGSLDGAFGPQTDAAYQSLRTATDAPSPLLMAPTPDARNPRLAIVAELQKLIGGRETDGANRSPVINKLWAYTSYPDGWKDRAPYCAATICACAHRAAQAEPRLAGFPLPTSPSVAGLLEWGTDPKNGCVVFTPNHPILSPTAGDIAIFLPKISHTGLVAADDDHSGTLHTLEGNTNGAGSRDGDGFWVKTRAMSLVGHFIRIAANA